MTARGTRLRRTAVALVGVALASGCSSLHPGNAAVVGDRTVQVSTVDDLAQAVCVSNDARAVHNAAYLAKTATRDLRRSILNVLVQADVVEQAAASLGVSVTPAAVNDLLGNRRLVPPSVSTEDTNLLLDLYHEIGRAHLLTAAIGREQLKRAGTTGASHQDVTQAGNKFLAAYADRIGVDVDPRFGTYSPSGGIVGESGSLSVPISAAARQAQSKNLSTAAIDQLPQTQTC